MGRPQTEETKRKLREAVQKRFGTVNELRTCACGETFSASSASATKFCNRKCFLLFCRTGLKVESIWDLSPRTITKIFKRMKLGCSVCRWSQTTCDIHHIRGRKISDPHHHSNLCYLCPNHHREVHEGKRNIDSLISLNIQIGDSWREYYFSEISNNYAADENIGESRVSVKHVPMGQ